MRQHTDGFVTPGFEPVADAFTGNFDERGDSAASCVVYAGGVPVVDLWAGATGRGAWTPDTRTVVFSVSKGVTTICVLMAAERGLIDLDAPVAKYWPEYAANGKEATTVRDVLAHRAGVIAPDKDLTAADLLDWHPVTETLAQQAPAWEPGSTYAYHPLTFGWLAGEVLRRATGQRPSEWLRDRIAGPLNLTMTYGADPAAADFCPMQTPLPDTDLEQAAVIAEMFTNPLVAQSMTLGGLFDLSAFIDSANGPEYIVPEIPGGNLITTARSLARLYAATVGEVDGVRLLNPSTVDDAAAVRSQGKPFVGIDEGNRWGTGFMLHSARRGMAGAGSFGHDGMGGHLAFAHPSGVSFAYQTARPGGVPDDRAEALCRALRTCL